MKYYLGIDVGTTNIKAAAFDRQGGLAAYGAVPTPIAHPRQEWSEFEPQAIWRAVCASVGAVIRQLGAGRIASVGVSAMAETGIPLDGAGEPLYNFIAWYDMRSQPQCEALISRMGKERIYQITGQTASAKYGITKAMWLRDRRPDIDSRTCHWLSMEDYILWRLTGQMATDYSAASRTMAFDIHRLAWSGELLAEAGIQADRFPPVYPGGTAIGQVSGEAARASGLRQGTCVSTGGHDHACAAIAVNIFEEGTVLDSMGTGEVSMAAISRPVVNQAAFGGFYSIYPHCGRPMYRALTSNQACGLTIDWFLNSFCADMLARERREGVSRYDQLFEAMRLAPDRHEGLFFLPMLRGTVEQAGMSGGFIGISDLHDRGDFIAAMTDGLLFELKRQVDGYERTFGERCRRVCVVGGASKSAVLMQRKADVHNAPVNVPRVTEAACLGAALLGAVGAGEMGFEALGEGDRLAHAYVPAKERVRGDQVRFGQYQALRRLAMAADAAWHKEDRAHEKRD